MNACSFHKCDRTDVVARGLCHKHYNRMHRRGELSSDYKPTRIQAFHSLYNIKQECWAWSGSKTNRGYATFWNGKKLVLGHRWSFEYFVRPIRKGMEIDHLCRNRSCVNPKHLEEVTRQENVKRQFAVPRSHCKAGHEYTDENTYVYPNGKQRNCRTCYNLWYHRVKVS